MDIHLILDSTRILIGGALLTLELTILSLVIGFMISVPLAFIRASRSLPTPTCFAARRCWCSSS